LRAVAPSGVRLGRRASLNPHAGTSKWDITYILTTFSAAMFGKGGPVHVRPIELEEAQGYVSERTKLWLHG
jgi:hypothetical protein